MIYIFEISWRHSRDFGTIDPNICEFLACLSVCQLAYFLTEITQILGYLQFWIRYLSEFFWTHSWDIGTLAQNNSEFLVCLSYCQMAYFLTEIRQIQGYFKFWMIYLCEIFWRYFCDIPTLVPNIFNFFVYLSVFQLAYILTEIRLKFRQL